MTLWQSIIGPTFLFSQACDLLQGLIPQREELGHEKDAVILSREHYERLYVFVIMWSVGAFLELDDR